MQVMDRKIKVFHTEDYKIMRDGIRALLQQDPDIEMVGESNNDTELFEKVKQLSIDVLILDISLKGMNLYNAQGFDICETIHREYPSIKIIAHTAHDHADHVGRMLQAGGVGFVSKKSGFEELIRAIKTVYMGNLYICSNVVKRLKNLDAYLLGLEPTLRSKDDRFSQREREIMNLLATGRSSREIADLLFIAYRTVDTHRKNLIEKAGVKNTAELIAYGAYHGLLKK
jgi:DNA-binding NarL/FixJ family response regulator